MDVATASDGLLEVLDWLWLLEKGTSGFCGSGHDEGALVSSIKTTTAFLPVRVCGAKSGGADRALRKTHGLVGKRWSRVPLKGKSWKFRCGQQFSWTQGHRSRRRVGYRGVGHRVRRKTLGVQRVLQIPTSTAQPSVTPSTSPLMRCSSSGSLRCWSWDGCWLVGACCNVQGGRRKMEVFKKTWKRFTE